MDPTTARLVEHALDHRFDELDEGLVHEAKRRVIDTIACAVGGYHEPVSRMAREVARRQSGSPSATVWGARFRTTPEAAAFANGVMLRCLDLSDTYRRRSGGHPSDVSAAVLAVADAVEADGPTTIGALAVAYDVYCSFCDAIDINTKGWDQPVYGVVASAVGVGRVLGLSREQMGHAVGLALAPNMALMQTRKGDLSIWKGAAAGNASRNGVFAAYLAQAGMSGPTSVIEGAGGLWDAVGRFDWQPMSGSPFIARTNLKRYPVCYHGQGAIEAALALREQIEVVGVAEIVIETYAPAVLYMGSEPSRWAPQNRETADHSLPFVVALALVEGEVDADSFDARRLADPAILRLMAVTTVVEDAALSERYPTSAPCRITVGTARGGRNRAEVASPEGHSDRPLSDAALEDKFRVQFGRFAAASQADAVLNALWRLDACGSVREPLALLRATEPASNILETA